MSAQRPARTSQPAGTRWSVLFSSARQDWSTPDGLFHELDQEFHFTIDACANKHNKKCERYYTPEQNGLTKNWGRERVWCNPPYDDLATWLQKAHESSQQGALVVMLIPSRTDTRAWHEHAVYASEIRFIRGRLKFGNAKNGAPFPSALVIFKPPITRPVQLHLWETTP